MRRFPVLVLVATLGLARHVSAQPFDPALYGEMRWRLVGPFRGGWTTAVEGIPDETQTFYSGAAGGGVWRTDDAGRTWVPLFDHESAASIGALAIAPSDPRVIYVGTGQIHGRYDLSSGDGVFRSDDGGKTWNRAGLGATRAIGRILVDPRDPKSALVAAFGHVYGPNRERGVFRTEDGGRSWAQTLFVDENTGGADLARDPENPSVVYAALWEGRNYPWLSYFKPMAGPGSGLYKSVDGGRSWKRVSGSGWPSGDLGRIGVAAAGRGRVWALVDAPVPLTAAPPQSLAGLYRSDDAGASWTRVNATPGLANSYTTRVTPDPRNPDVVFVTGQSIRRSEDGGKTFDFFKGAPGGDDYHFFWINPKHPEFMAAASDQGTVVSVNGGETWSDWYNQPTGQFYHVETDGRFPYWIYSGQQDSGTVGIASRSDYGALTYREWHPVGGEERGWDVPDPSDPLIVYGTGLGGTVTRFDTRTGEVQNVSPSVESTYGQRPSGPKNRYTWISPLVASPRPPHLLYFGSQYLLRSADDGHSWEAISPDLSGAESGATGCSGDLTPAAAQRCGFGVIYTIALGSDDREIWVGTDDGRIRRTHDGGKTWDNVTPRGLSAWSKVASLDLSALEPGTAYAAVDRHRLDDFSPHVFRTHDDGRTWQEVTTGLPASRFVSVVRADPVRRGLLYAGTDGGVFVSFDDGGHWQPLQGNLPTAWVGDLSIHGNDLIAATQGRALWVLDDVTPLRQMSTAVAGAPAHLFAPASAVRVRPNENRDTPLPPETPMGKNPPPGAVIDYVLGAGAMGPLRLEILDAKGQSVRVFSSDDAPESVDARRYFKSEWARPPAPPSIAMGHHRFVWDLRYPRPPATRYGYSIAAIRGEDTPIEPSGPLVPPGRYTVRLTVDGRRQEQPLVVEPDPRVHATEEVLARNFELERSVTDAMQASFAALEQVRALRKQLGPLKERAGTGPVAQAVAGLDRKAERLEGAGRGAAEDEDEAAGAPGADGLAQLNARLATILTAVDASDASATAVQVETFHRTRADLDDGLRQWKQIAGEDLVALNATLRAAGLPPIEIGGRAK